MALGSVFIHVGTPYAGLELYLGQRFALALELGLPVLFTLVYAHEGRLGAATQHGATGALLIGGDSRDQRRHPNRKPRVVLGGAQRALW